MTTTVYDSNNPVVKYVEDNLWGNPEENHQYQVKLVRVTDDYGVSMNYNYMGKWRALPKVNTFFHIFSAGGLHPGFWNFRNNVLYRNPLDRWVNLGALCKVRGMQLDLYNTKGFQYSRSNCWVMITYDGLVLIALQKAKNFPVPKTDEFFFRCFTPSIPIDFGDLAISDAHNPYTYETMTYESTAELAIFTARYSLFKGKPGFTGVMHNGVFFDGAPNALQGLQAGDLVEFWHDPTVIRVERYNYSSLKDYYSSLDSKRKLILHPPKRNGDYTLRYFDDNDYYVIGPKGRGLYIHRNDETTLRQLTHVDVAIADDAVRNTGNYHPDLADTSKVRIMVLVRKTDWEYQWPNEHQRIKYLYRFDDAGIVRAMTGDRATVPEWTADGLESGTVMSLTRSQYPAVKRENASLALGYNAATRVVSETPVRVTFIEGGRGVVVPPTYRAMFSAWEYDADGHLLEVHNRVGDVYYSPFNPLCAMVEFVLGKAQRSMDYVVTKDDLTVDPEYDFRVYKQPWNVDLNQLVGEMVDVTGDDTIYTLTDGTIHWTGLDKVNYRGIVLTNKACLAYEFELDHIDHSLSFALTEIYEEGGLIFPMSFAQVDVWLNGHPLVDHVDWLYKDKYCYIINKEFIVDGPQKITVRAHGMHSDMDTPKFETELGFVEGGVIGRFGRYNLRGDRVTRTVINGALYPTDEVPRAEREVPDNLWNDLNGKPYMVKHVYCPIKFVEPYSNYPLYDRSRETDQRVSDYMTLWLPKPTTNAGEIDPVQPTGPGVPVIPNLQDKYRLFSPTMNAIVNAILNGLIVLPPKAAGDTVYTEQSIRETVKPYLWWWEVDPINLDFDRRYFAIMPYANFNKLTVTANELLFLNQVNESYLNSVCVLEGHFNVNNNVR